jgi:hypothetical protein
MQKYDEFQGVSSDLSCLPTGAVGRRLILTLYSGDSEATGYFQMVSTENNTRQLSTDTRDLPREIGYRPIT